MWKKYGWIFTVSLSLTAIAFSLAAFQKGKKQEEAFRTKLFHLARQCVQFNDSMTHKEDILRLLDQVEDQECVLEEGNDDLRVKYVFSQGCIEHVLACSQALGEVTDLIGMIHTPTPATPLCTKPEPLDEGLLDESIRFDLNKLLTVRSRAQIIREYLIKGGILYIVYPKGGLEKRTPEQQEIYLQELKNYPSQLINWVLNATKIQPQMVGATYFFRNSNQEVYVFSIKSTQANSPETKSEWGLWLGEIKSPIIKRRIEELFAYFETCDGPKRLNFKI